MTDMAKTSCLIQPMETAFMLILTVCLIRLVEFSVLTGEAQMRGLICDIPMNGWVGCSSV